MDPLASLPDGFVWTGSLEETDIRSLYAACYSLRFSGRLELADAGQRAEVVFVAGEPVEIDGGDTQRIALWTRGTFRAVQTIPSLAGDLTREREVAGSLGQTKPSQLWAWVSEYRLTCEIDLERPGSKAVVTFQNGHAESAQVNGLPELAALARVSSWTDGSFRVRLRPLFIDAVIPCAPPMPDSAPPLDPRGFDVSRAIPMDLRNKPASPFPGAVSRPPPAPTPPLGELAIHDATRKSGSHAAPREERTALTQPLPPPRPQDFGSIDDVALLPRRKRSKAPWVASLLAIVIAGGLGALYYFHLPPFSPPPRPIVEALPKPIAPPVTKPDEKTAKPDEKAAKPDEKTAKPDEKTAGPDEKTAKPDEKTATPDEKTVKPDEKSAKAEKTPKVEKLTAREKAARDKAEKLIARGRALLAEGHEHTALDWFKRADHLWPKNPDLHIYEQQALGKLGRAELYLEGKGAVVIDGHRFSTPRKVRLAAGPHTVVN
ncbi:MAG: hypothetical protein ACHQ17_06530, partial [Polyangia bacterium]